MKLTIVKEDNAVYIDGVSREVDCSSLPEDFHALQWDEDNGEVEFSTVSCPTCKCKSRKPNLVLTHLGDYQSFITAWEAAAPVEAQDAS